MPRTTEGSAVNSSITDRGSKGAEALKTRTHHPKGHAHGGGMGGNYQNKPHTGTNHGYKPGKRSKKY